MSKASWSHILLLGMCVVAGYLSFQLWATTAALEKIVSRLVVAEAGPKCAAEIKRQGIEITDAELKQGLKRFEYRLGGHYTAPIWDITNPLWRPKRIDVFVYLNPQYDYEQDRSVMTDVLCRFNVSSGYASS